MKLTDELRKSVLQYAIQGKITSHLDTDTPVEKTLSEFKNEIDILEKNKERKKAKDSIFSENEDIPFDIPETWKWVYLNDIVKTITAGGDKPKNFSKTKTEKYKVPVYSNGETNLGLYGYTNKAVINERSLTVSGRGTIGFSVIREEPYVPIVRLLVVKPLEKTNLKYIKYALDSLIEYGNGTAVKQLTVPMLQPKLIPFPPIEEQDRIVKKLDLIMKEIDDYSTLEEQLCIVNQEFPNELAKSIMQSAIQGKMSSSKSKDIDSYILEIKKIRQELIDEKKIHNKKKTSEINDIPFDIPDYWRWIRFGDIADFKLGKTPDRTDTSLWGNDYKWFSIADMIPNAIINESTEGVTEKCFVNTFNKDISPKGTLIMSFKLTVGRVSILGCDAFHNEAIISIFPYKDFDNTLRDYLFKVLPFLVKYGNTKNAIMGSTLNSTSINDLLIPLPPFDEQKVIIEKLDKILLLCDNLEQL